MAGSNRLSKTDQDGLIGLDGLLSGLTKNCEHLLAIIGERPCSNCVIRCCYTSKDSIHETIRQWEPLPFRQERKQALLSGWLEMGRKTAAPQIDRYNHRFDAELCSSDGPRQALCLFWSGS